MGKIRRCPGCGKIVQEDVQSCPHCNCVLGNEGVLRVREERIDGPQPGDVDQSMMSRKSSGPPPKKPSVVSDVTVGLAGLGARRARVRGKSASGRSDGGGGGSGPHLPRIKAGPMGPGPGRDMSFGRIVLAVLMWIACILFLVNLVLGFGKLPCWLSLIGIALALPLGFMDGVRESIRFRTPRRVLWVFVLLCASTLALPSESRLFAGGGGGDASRPADVVDGPAAIAPDEGASVDDLIADGYVRISLETLYEFGYCMDGEKVITSISIMNKSGSQLGAKAGNDGSSASRASILFAFDDRKSIKSCSDGDAVSIAGTVSAPDGKGQSFYITGCRVLGDASVAGDLAYDAALGESLVEKDRLRDRVPGAYTPLNEFRYELDPDARTIRLTEYTGSSDMILISPVYSVTGVDYSVASIAGGCFGACPDAAGIVSVCLPEGVVSIDASAFLGLAGLRSLYLPASLVPGSVGGFTAAFPYANLHFGWDISGALPGPRDTADYFKRVDEVVPEGQSDDNSGGKNGFEVAGDLIGGLLGALGDTQSGEPLFYTEIFFAGTEEQWAALGLSAG